MKSTSKYFIYVLLAGVFTSGQLLAQETAGIDADIDYIRKSNAWLSSKNAAGLTHYNTVNVTNAVLNFQKKDGGFRNYFQSDDSQEYGLQADSYSRLNKNVVFSGGFGYKNFKGKNMSGSAFIDPYQTPFDIVELDAANKGTKELELYRLNGAVGAQVSSKLSIGAKLDYQAGNYAKRRDLRHINKLLVMDLSAGALYQVSDAVEIGANYNYSRRIESLSFKVAGNKDRQYLSLISFGSFYGRTELFDQYGYTAGGTTNPLKDIRQGASLQLNISFDKNVTLFNEFSYADRNGFYGEEGTSSILLTRHHGSDFAYNGRLSIKAAEIEHQIGLKADYNFLENRETIYRRETTIGELNRIVYYGDRKVFSAETLNAGLTYDLFMGVKNNHPTWAVNFTADYMSRDQSTGLYPYYRDQKINSYQFSGQVTRSYHQQKNTFDIGLGIGYGAGTGAMAKDGTLATPAEGNPAPTTMPQFLQEEYEFLTASRIKGNLMLKYTKALKDNLGAYLKLDYSHIYSGDVTFLGKHFNTTNISIGCNF
ncbi:DUF6850 family outer membrane beta-barrel protein [Pedobacter gandavensis]|uniref:DUF6850 domain-containing protein n=1 Tax=Pedobacter gandavensis TaxID=2679963 RepID=A0ABR6F1K6_9SPHI|nr:DUF6850 family outer membrane beta-barrel protein [Pedobacter gandavensis]MBB2151418.1 hypothetical protein [Pedobacter gandavensis]